MTNLETWRLGLGGKLVLSVGGYSWIAGCGREEREGESRGYVPSGGTALTASLCVPLVESVVWLVGVSINRCSDCMIDSHPPKPRQGGTCDRRMIQSTMGYPAFTTSSHIHELPRFPLDGE
jgi:hypothetical protein